MKQGAGSERRAGEVASAPPAHMVAAVLREGGVEIPPGAVEMLVGHAAEMLRWNRSIRLTSLTRPRDVAVKHILDSLFLLRFGPFPGRILDFGSGAGFPGIPLAVALPGSRVVLLEASGRKCAFLAHVRARLGLDNVSVVRGRLEARSPFALGRFEHAVTRAVLPPGETLALLTPCLAPGGRILLMTGPRTRKAAELVPPHRGKAPQVVALRTERIELPFGMGVREIREFREA